MGFLIVYGNLDYMVVMFVTKQEEEKDFILYHNTINQNHADQEQNICSSNQIKVLNFARNAVQYFPGECTRCAQINLKLSL